MEIGLRVVRGPDWKWGNQDDGEGHVGTIVEIRKHGSMTSPQTVVIQWDSGFKTYHAFRYQGVFDLCIFDAAAVGITHKKYYCDGCKINPIQGMRWKCSKCKDFDLCTPCYMDDKHNLEHSFRRFDTASSTGVTIPKRRDSTKIRALGTFSGVRVVRIKGPDLDPERQDGGKDDLRYVKEASESFYYRDHLPALETQLKDPGKLSNDEHNGQPVVESVPSEFKSDPYSLNLFQQVISQGEEIDTTIRVNVVGNFAQGKTSLTKRLVGQTLEGIQSTNSVEINNCEYTYMNRGAISSMKIKDGGEPDYVDRILSVAQSEKEKRNLKMAISFVAKGAQFSDKGNVKYRKKNTELSKKAKYGAIRNKVASPRRTTMELNSSMFSDHPDTRKSLLTNKELNRLVERLNNASSEPKSKEVGEIAIWDFGGQFVFYATHTLFHSKRALYLLVFDLSKPLDEIVRDDDYPLETGDKTMEYFAKFWLSSIHSYVGSSDGLQPRVILVGTHKDKLQGDEYEKERLKDAYFEKIRSLFEDTDMINHIHSADFATNNTDPDDLGIANLRQEIIDVGTTSMKKAKIPARWIHLEKSLREIRYRKIIPFNTIVEIDSKNEFPLNEVEQIKLFLRYHHSKGTLFYFDEQPMSDNVVLDPQYLIDAFKCIITSERFCKKDPSCRPLWNILRNDARLEKELIEKLWRRDECNNFHSHTRILLMFLQKHYIISEASEYDEHSQKSKGLGWYIVPSLLRNPITEDTLKVFLERKSQTSVRYVMAFDDSSVVQVVYHRLLAALIGRWPVVRVLTSDKKSLLYENFGVLRLDDFHAGIVEIQCGNIELRLVKLGLKSNVDCMLSDRFRRFSESVVSSEFRKLRDSSIRIKKPFTASFRCNQNDHGFDGSFSLLTVEKIRNKSVLPCQDLMSHEIHIDKAMDEWFQEERLTQLVPDSQLTDKQISRISQAIGKNWEMLGTELGMTSAQVQQISMDNHITEMKIYRMLLKWKEMKGQMATVNSLIKAMKNVKKVHIEWDDIRNIADGLHESRLCTHF